MFTSAFEKQFVSDLRRLTVQPGDVLLVHSSMRSLGDVPGGANQVIRALIETLGPSGTLLMPALSYEFVSARQPLFDPRWTGTCVGAIPECFLKFVGVLRSMHPTHSVCGFGARARELLSRHHLDRTPVGANSPFTLMPQCRGKILMLGCGLRPNTSMHGVEELVEPPYLFREQQVEYVICSEVGQQVVTHKRHGFDGFVQRYDRLKELMPEGIVSGKVAQADSYLIDAEAMWSVARAALQRDPMYFVEKKGSGDAGK